MSALRTFLRDVIAIAAVLGSGAALGAHRWAMPDLGIFNLLWLARDPREQARSMIKLINAAFPSISADRGAVRRMARSIAHDTPPALRSLAAAGTQRGRIALRFEDILLRPLIAASTICRAFEIDAACADLMARQVVPRQPACLPFMLETL